MLLSNVKIRKKYGKDKSFFLKSIFIKINLCFCAVIFSLIFNSCRAAQKTEMRSLLPNNAFAYLEIGDLSKTLKALTNSQAFQELADKKTDFSALKNIQIAIAVTGFETSEVNSGLNFKPKFVAVAETHLWSWQTVSFAENQLDKFVRKNYGEDAKSETKKKDGGIFFSWTATDNRQVFAFVQGSLIYFGTDAATIEKCSFVKKGEADSLLKNESLSRAYAKTNLAFGYVSSEGVKKMADLIGVNVAVKATEESGGRSFIAGVLPQILQNTAQEIVWTANQTESGIEDKFSISLKAEISAVVKETLSSGELPAKNAVEFLPPDFFSISRYNLKNPLISWRSMLIVTAKNTDAISGRFLSAFSESLLEPYLISSPEKFLSTVDSEIITAQFDAEGEKSVAIVTIKDAVNIKNSISKEINFKSPPENQDNAEIWFSADRKFVAAFIENQVILGDGESVLRCLQAKQSGQNFAKNPNYKKFAASESVAATFALDLNSAENVVRVLAKKKNENRKLATFYLTETRFAGDKIERKTVSDFGLIGTVIAQIKK
jgi:hypothetical protein